MRVKAGLALSLSVALIGVCSVGVFAQGAGSDGATGQAAAANDQYPHVTALEQAILGTAYIGQGLSARLGRMETKAFGAPSKNPDFSSRTDALQQYAETTLHKSFPEMNADSATDGGNVADGQNGNAQAQSSGDDSASQTDYPRIDALEKDILGITFAGQPLSGRLARLELKAFGKASDSDDLGDRTDALEAYAVNTLHKAVVRDSAFGGGQPSGASDTASAGSSSGQTDYPRVDALEKAILGQTYVSEPLAGRLSRMEVTAFGKASDSDDLGDRTDALQKYSDKKLHKKILPDNATADSGGGPPKSGLDRVASMLGSALLGMAGAPIGGMGGIGPPIMGGGLIPGFGGIRARPRSQVEQQQQKPIETHAEDPAVYGKTPPPPEARLITKVGWCEVRTFGHTFSTMHLEERLTQLNRQINFDPGQSSIELMDHIGALMKVVETKPAAQAIVASPATTQ